MEGMAHESLPPRVGGPPHWLRPLSEGTIEQRTKLLTNMESQCPSSSVPTPRYATPGRDSPTMFQVHLGAHRCNVTHDARSDDDFQGFWPFLRDRYTGPASIKGEVVQTIPECCQLCGTTFGCVSWSFDRGTCSLRFIKPMYWVRRRAHNIRDTLATGFLVSPPCTRDCIFSNTSAPRNHLVWEEDPIHLRNMSTENYPWFKVLQDSPPPRRERPMQKNPLVAVCLAGAARSFIHSNVWDRVRLLRGSGLKDNNRRLHDLFLVLGTGPESNSKVGTPAAPHPLLLQRALNALQPVQVKTISVIGNFPCGNRAMGQFNKWAECVPLVRHHERVVNLRRNSSKRFQYDYLFKGRPDVAFFTPVDLSQIAAQLHRNTILGSNDVHLLLHRSRWFVLERLKSSVMPCSPLCDGASTPILRTYFKKFNEYCQLKVVLAQARVNHVEVSHPSLPYLLMPGGQHDWAAGLSAPFYRIVRFREEGTDTDFWASHITSQDDSSNFELKLPADLSKLIPRWLQATASKPDSNWWFLTAGLLGGTECDFKEGGKSVNRFFCTSCTNLHWIPSKPSDFVSIVGENTVRWLLYWIFRRFDLAHSNGFAPNNVTRRRRDFVRFRPTNSVSLENIPLDRCNYSSFEINTTVQVDSIAQIRQPAQPLRTKRSMLIAQQRRVAAISTFKLEGLSTVEIICAEWMNALSSRYDDHTNTAKLREKCFLGLEHAHPLMYFPFVDPIEYKWALNKVSGNYLCS